MATPRATHLWVFVHGLHGTPQDFAYMTETLKSQHAKQEAEEVRRLCCGLLRLTLLWCCQRLVSVRTVGAGASLRSEEHWLSLLCS
eukprot:m.201458 g.201458  ORF g.201458 m.201458 type:complete len:86 (+) comp18419_c1_seq11:764-1021(+)